MRFLSSFPKSGTYLMRHILELDDEESKMVSISVGDNRHPVNYRAYPNGISGHLECHKIVFDLARDMNKFFIIRDPRDIVVSWLHYANKIGGHHALRRLRRIDINVKNVVNIKGAEDRMMAVIKSVRPYMTGYLDWSEHATTVRYEKLLSEPEKELATVAEILGEPLDKLVERSKFRGGKTFRKGVAGEWKKEFSQDHIKFFDEIYADVMERWNYT